MNLSQLADQSLHHQLKNFVQQERALLTQVLEHLQEVERRRLYSDFKRSSLFDYAVSELGYSEDQAHRRIQAMRLMKELPEIKERLNNGALSLTNAAKAQSLFRKMSQSSTFKPLDKKNKLAVLKTIESKSTREAERELLKLQPHDMLPADRQKSVTPTHTEMRVVLDQNTVAKLEEVRGLLGPKGGDLSHDELLQVMAEATIAKLKEKRFGKRRVQEAAKHEQTAALQAEAAPCAQQVDQPCSKNQRYLSPSMKHAVWEREQGQCCQCGSRKRLQFDHIQPIGLGGRSSMENLRLLCFSCNQRAGMRVYGVEAMLAAVEKSQRGERLCASEAGLL